jgi:hypothetical protein
VGEKAMSAKDRSLDKYCAEFMQRICQKYDNVAEVDKLAAVARKVDTVKIVMQENVDAALQNCVKLESIEMAAGTQQACLLCVFFLLPVLALLLCTTDGVLIPVACLNQFSEDAWLHCSRIITCVTVSSHRCLTVYLSTLSTTTHNNRGPPAAGGHLQKERPRPEEQDVVEGHAGTTLAAVYHVVMYLWSTVLCAKAECVCCIVNVVGCWTQLFTVLSVNASTAFAAVFTSVVGAVLRCLCWLVCATRAPYFCTSTTQYMHLLPPSQLVSAVLNLPSVGSVTLYALQVWLTLAVACVQMKIAIVVIILAILGIIIGVAVAMSKANSSK